MQKTVYSYVVVTTTSTLQHRLPRRKVAGSPAARYTQRRQPRGVGTTDGGVATAAPLKVGPDARLPGSNGIDGSRNLRDVGLKGAPLGAFPGGADEIDFRKA